MNIKYLYKMILYAEESIKFPSFTVKCVAKRWTAHESSGVTILRAVWGKAVCGMCYSVVNKVVICHGLDSKSWTSTPT